MFIQNLQNNWKLFKSRIEDSKKFFNKFVPNEELRETRKYFTNIKSDIDSNNLLNIFNTNEIIYNNIKKNNKKWMFYDFFKNKHFEVYNILFFNNETVIFIINKQNPTFIVQNYAYMTINYIGYIKQKTLIQINHYPVGGEMDLPIIEKYIGRITKSSRVSNRFVYKQIIFFGFISNVGHHLWNELSGLNIFLQNKNLFEKIDGICIGPYDHFNIKDYLKQNYNFTIIMYNNTDIQSLNIFPIFLNSVILDNNIPKIFNKIINYKIVPKESNTLEFALEIRTYSRILINTHSLYVNIINSIYYKYNSKYKIKIFFLGRFSTNYNSINCENDTECIEQNNLVLKIMNQVNNNDIIFENLIGQHFSLIFNKTMNTTYNIVIAGTSMSTLMNWVYNKKVIVMCSGLMYNLANSFVNCLQKDEDIIILTPIEYITNSDGCNFIVNDEDKFIDFLLNILNSTGL